MSNEERSSEACPRCGEHRLRLVEAPVTELTSFDMGNQAMGTDTIVDGAPGIECLACGATWRDLAAFRAEQAGGLPASGDDAPG